MTDAERTTSGIASGSAELVGRFVWYLADDSWWWSEGMYRIHGFRPGEVAPSSDVLRAHQHPEDADEAAKAVQVAVTDGSPFSYYHRIVDARRKVRRVVVAGIPVRDESGTVVEVRGFFVDLTTSRRRDTHADVEAALEGAARHRAAIEQAKGMLMLAYGVDEDEAFTMLRACSQAANIKLNALAETIAAELPRAGLSTDSLRQGVGFLLGFDDHASTDHASTDHASTDHASTGHAPADHRPAGHAPGPAEPAP